MGGVTDGATAVEMMLAGASLVGVGTVCITDPYAPIRIINGIKDYMAGEAVKCVSDLTGKAVMN